MNWNIINVPTSVESNRNSRDEQTARPPCGPVIRERCCIISTDRDNGERFNFLEEQIKNAGAAANSYRTTLTDETN